MIESHSLDSVRQLATLVSGNSANCLSSPCLPNLKRHLGKLAGFELSIIYPQSIPVSLPRDFSSPQAQQTGYSLPRCQKPTRAQFSAPNASCPPANRSPALARPSAGERRRRRDSGMKTTATQHCEAERSKRSLRRTNENRNHNMNQRKAVEPMQRPPWRAQTPRGALNILTLHCRDRLRERRALMSLV